MILVNLKGGLGNQLFQYAAAKNIALKTKQKIYFITDSFLTDPSNRKYALYRVGIKFNRPTLLTKSIFFNPKGLFRLLRHKVFNVRKINDEWLCPTKTIKLKSNGWYYLNGYWQNLSYFNDTKPKILEDFKFDSSIQTKIQDIISINRDKIPVGVHVRRGDYISNSMFNSIYTVLDDDYYTEAISLILNKINNPVFIFVSEEHNWIKNVLLPKLPEINFYIPNEMNMEEDLFLLSQCKHIIMANSSFSWWGAYMNESDDKIVVAPKNWLKNQANSNIVINQLIPSTWITI